MKKYIQVSDASLGVNLVIPYIGEGQVREIRRDYPVATIEVFEW